MKKITLVEFFADWCSVCAMQNPILDKLEKDFGNNVEFIKLNIDKNKDITSKLEIDAVPTIFILKNSDVFKHHIGFLSEDELRTYLNQVQDNKSNIK